MKYSKVELKEVKCCSLCKRQIARCGYCNTNFEVNDEVICEVRHHFHQKCNNKYQESLHWIGLKQQPTEEAITELNMKLGRLIKELRDGDETDQKKTEIDELIKLNRRLPTLF